MARPKRYGQRKSTAIRFEPELLERLHAHADARDVSVNLLVNRGAEMLCDALEAPSQSGLLPGRLVTSSVTPTPVEKQRPEAAEPNRGGKCKHPIGRRIGDHCGECGKQVK
jgi:hypothetical protein